MLIFHCTPHLAILYLISLSNATYVNKAKLEATHCLYAFSYTYSSLVPRPRPAFRRLQFFVRTLGEPGDEAIHIAPSSAYSKCIEIDLS